MPLLRKKVFLKTQVPEFLRDDEEVFHCVVTNEIFRDYEEFCERIILVNSMVWSCTMTGKANLTYAEALQSEENARKNIKDFPMELYIPALYLASKTKRTAWSEMVEDVFMYLRDRYFVGEIVEASFSENKWLESHVLQVIAPTEGQIKAAAVRNGKSAERQFYPPSHLYRYEIEQLDADDADVSQIMIVECSQVRRKKGAFSRERNRIFLKQFVELNSVGVWVIKESAMNKYGINRVKFDQIFDGPLPDFDPSKKLTRVHVNGRKSSPRQATLAKFLEKNCSAAAIVSKKNLMEEMKKQEELYKQKCAEEKRRIAEEKYMERQRLREENVKWSMYLKDWYKPKEDLQLEDHKKIPESIPVNTKLPVKYFGDALMVVEFVNSFSKILSTKDFFPSGLTIELMERSLTEKQVAGPLTDIIQMLLTALFNVQDEETLQYKTDLQNQTEINEDDIAETLSLSEATHLATLASKWSNKYQGIPLGRLPMYSLTVSEILRLHLLGSGARINETGAKWRYQQRGGYTSEDDPGLNLRVKQPHILKALSMHNITQLSIPDKLKILSCLVNQLLTYADVRDVIEERLENTRQAKADIRLMHTAERRREQEFVSTRIRMKREGKEDKEALAKDIEKLEAMSEMKKVQFEEKILKLTKASTEYQVCMGTDRSFQNYVKLESVPGLFVCKEEDYYGMCFDEIVAQNPDLLNAQSEATLSHIRRLYEELNSSDKENKPSTPKKVNGWRNSLKEDTKTAVDLSICTANMETCPVHSNNFIPKWGFYTDEEQVVSLIESLNKRGIRESELRNILAIEKEELVKLVGVTPVSYLNPDHNVETEDRPTSKRIKNKSQYEDANLGYPVDMETCLVLHLQLVENILEMEEKIFAGNLGQLKVKDRSAWRNHLTNRNYAELDLTLVKKEDQLSKVKKENRDSRPNTPDNSYRDPGRYLGVTLEADSDDSDMDVDGSVLSIPEDQKVAIQSLAHALIQVAQAVDAKYMKKPLGHADASAKKKDYDVLERWEQSLLASTSYSQIFLHYGTLDSCVMWSRSATLARCRICHRQRDPENMLLCDACNKGHHLYCLKPKLTSVPKGNWYCDKCTKEKQLEETPSPRRKTRKIFSENEDEDEDEEDADDTTIDEVENGDVSMDEVCTMCGTGGHVLCCDNCPKVYHLECAQPPLRRVPRGKWLCHKCRAKKNNSSRQSSDSNSGDDDSPTQRRSNRREAEARQDLPLHNAPLQELLSDIMKHKDGWPFTRPVQRNEVPDYYEVIEKPMDFGTIKYKLNMGDYKCDADFMVDAVLVFENCNTYNNSDAAVYKCGVRLLKFFTKRSKELGLKLPEDMDDEVDDNEDDEQPAPTKPKKRRTY